MKFLLSAEFGRGVRLRGAGATLRASGAWGLCLADLIGLALPVSSKLPLASPLPETS